MQTLIASIKAGYHNSVSDDLVVEKPWRTPRRQNKASIKAGYHNSVSDDLVVEKPWRTPRRQNKASIKAGYHNSVSDDLVVEKPGRTPRRQNKASIKAGYHNSVSDDLVVEKPGRTPRRQNKADATNTWCGGSSKENLPSFWKIELEIYVRLGPFVFLYHEDVDFQISDEFSEFKSSEICS